ncbi:MAG: hypothetical protein O3B03_00845 [Proteobacteria bacterium]|nr:hypothetical protein [Pseudomonadota bacterium]
MNTHVNVRVGELMSWPHQNLKYCSLMGHFPVCICPILLTGSQEYFSSCRLTHQDLLHCLSHLGV